MGVDFVMGTEELGRCLSGSLSWLAQEGSGSLTSCEAVRCHSEQAESLCFKLKQEQLVNVSSGP